MMGGRLRRSESSLRVGSDFSEVYMERCLLYIFRDGETWRLNCELGTSLPETPRRVIMPALARPVRASRAG